MKTRFVVIGSNSFTGAHFVDHLLTKEFKVLGISRSKEPNAVFLPYRENNENIGTFQFLQADLSKDMKKISSAISEFVPQYVVNFSAQGMVEQSWAAPADWYETNIVSQVRLHEELRHLNSLIKYVHVTTPEAYGSTDGWVPEHFNYAPTTPYAVSKGACDLHLLTFLKKYRFPVVFTRAANVYGPGQQLYRIIPRTMLYARMGKKLQLHSGGRAVRSFIHIKDVVEATNRIALEGVVGQAYHIATHEMISIRELVMKICRLTNVCFSSFVQESGERLGQDQAYRLDTTRFREELCWDDKWDLEDGLKNTLEWIDANIGALDSLPTEYEHRV